MEDVAQWLDNLKLGKYEEAFALHGIDCLERVAELTSDRLTEMGITLQGHRNRILKHLPEAEADSSGTAPPDPPPSQPQQEQEQEQGEQEDQGEQGAQAVPEPKREAHGAQQSAGDSGHEKANRGQLTRDETINQLDNILGDIEGMLGDLDGPSQDDQAEDAIAGQQQTQDQLQEGAQPQQGATDGDRDTGGQVQTAAVLSDMQDSDLDALLADLCTFGTEGDKVVERKPEPAQPVELVPEVPATSRPSQRSTASEGSSGGGSTSVDAKRSSTAIERPVMRKEEGGLTRQMSARPGVPQDVAAHLDDFRKRLSSTGQISHHDLESMMKEEKIRIAMEKMAAAQNQQAVIKVVVGDGTSKTLCIEAKETAFEVCRKLVVKNRFEDSPFWQLVEVCPTLGVEREYEDHEQVSYHYNAWPPFSDYSFHLRVNEDKYGIFVTPERYFPRGVREDIEATAQTSQLAGKAKRRLFQEYFTNTSRVPDVKGHAHIKEGKKWKKRFCILRASGIYFSTKGESEASKDLQAYVKFNDYQLCTPLASLLSKVKAPTQDALAFRPNIRKRQFEAQDLLLLAVPDTDERNIWTAGVRFAMFGADLREGYEETCKRFEKLAELGEFNPENAKGIQAPVRKDARTVNKKLVKKWQSMRAASSDSPNVSAATGVEFDDGTEEVDESAGSGAIPPELVEHKWFHGAISRLVAEELLASYNHAQGCFLVRESSSHPGDYVISLCFDSKPHHYKVNKIDTGEGRKYFGLDQGPRFPRLADLVSHYKRASGKLPTPLALEVPRKD